MGEAGLMLGWVIFIMGLITIALGTSRTEQVLGLVILAIAIATLQIHYTLQDVHGK